MILFKDLKRNSINSQIIIAFVALSALIIALEVLAYAWITQMLVINSLKESSSLLKEKQLLLKNSANEFILREKTNELFFSSGKSVFLERYAGLLNELKKSVEVIRKSENDLNVIDGEEVEHLKITIDQFNEVFLQMTEKIKKRGYGKYGLIGEFEKSISVLLQYDFGSDNAAVLNLELFVKDYLLTGDENLIENISDEVFNFTMALENHVKDEEVEKVSNILINYEDVFKQLTVVDSELGIYTGGGLQGSLFAASDNLEKAIQLEKINARINEAYSDNVNKLYLSFFLVIGAAIIAAITINRILFKTLVAPIQEMKTIISKMSRGEIPNTSVRFKVDELNEMAKALNNLVAGTRNYQNFANNIGKGNLDTAFTPLSEQDILGNSLLTMRENLKSSADEDKKRTRAAQGLAELSALLRNHTASESELHNIILQFIVKCMECSQGSLFLLNKENESEKYLELAACYAWDKRKYLEKRIELGDGLVGQCAMAQEVIYITDLPKEYIKITSGLGGYNPGALLIVPLIIDDQVEGVLEIASFQKFEDYQIDLVKKFSESVASAIHVETVNKKTKLLLQHAQEQTEQLLSQEEEMKQNMEEMQATQEGFYRREREYIEKIESMACSNGMNVVKV